MKLPFLDTVLWAAGPILNAALIVVLCLRRRLHKFPVLASWCIFTIISAVTHFIVYRVASDRVYALVYWIAEGIDALLQIGVVVEVARTVFQPLNSPLRRTRLWLALAFGCSVLVSFAIVLWIHPAAQTRAGVWEIRGDIFTSLVISGMFSLVLVGSQRLGLHWRSHVMSIGYGLMVWAVTTIVIGLLHGYWGTYAHYLAVEHVRMIVYLSILCYWIGALWRNEPEKRVPTSEMRNAVLQVTDRVSYDLAKVLGTPEKESH